MTRKNVVSWNDPGTEKDISGKIGEIQMKSVA